MHNRCQGGYTQVQFQLTLLVDGCSDGSVVWFRIVFIYVTNVLHFRNDFYVVDYTWNGLLLPLSYSTY